MILRRLTYWPVFLLGTLAISLLPAALAETPEETFETHIRPLLHKHCLECHRADLQVTEGGLALDSREGWQRGGSRGPAVIPFEPDSSLLWRVVSDSSSDLQMPPEGKERLTDIELARLKEWILLGAPDPRGSVPRIAGMTADEADQWWAFQPVPSAHEIQQAIATIGTNSQASSSSSPIDQIISATHQAQGISPTPRADQQTLVRRASFDLTGLPPLSNVVHDFEQYVEQLLAAPEYGERYARHWLDLMRYADYLNHHGGPDRRGSVVEFYEAWKYRDWVVRAFNEDRPFNEFLHMQIAGDLNPPAPDGAPDADGMIATTWMAMGAWDNGDADKHKIVSDIVDDQINIVGQAMLGITLACARCHDHKFDPVTIEDYYGLAGIFYSSRVLSDLGAKGQHTELLRTPLASPAYILERERQQTEIKQLEEQIKGLVGMPSEDSANPVPEEVVRLQGQLDQLRSCELAEPPMAMAVREGGTPGSLFPGIQDVPLHRRGNYTELGPVVPRGLPLFLAGSLRSTVTSGSGRRELADWIATPENPLVARVIANRVWQWHFGNGIVTTPSNFGKLGAKPTNPLLLEYLARTLIDSGYSIKHLHRVIMRSEAYQRSGTNVLTHQQGTDLLAADPDNALLSHFSARRLSAEEIRDALLVASGRLDLQPGGPADIDHFSYRRTFYVQQPRYQRAYFTNLFDGADVDQTIAQRSTSTAAPQALYFLNHPFMIRTSSELVDELLRASLTDASQQVHWLYQRVFGRAPLEEELQVTIDFLLTNESNTYQERLAELCHILLATNEFIYVK